MQDTDWEERLCLISNIVLDTMKYFLFFFFFPSSKWLFCPSSISFFSPARQLFCRTTSLTIHCYRVIVSQLHKARPAWSSRASARAEVPMLGRHPAVWVTEPPRRRHGMGLAVRVSKFSSSPAAFSPTSQMAQRDQAASVV